MQNDIRAPPRQLDRHGPANAARSAGDDGYLTFQ